MATVSFTLFACEVICQSFSKKIYNAPKELKKDTVADIEVNGREILEYFDGFSFEKMRLACLLYSSLNIHALVKLSMETKQKATSGAGGSNALSICKKDTDFRSLCMAFGTSISRFVCVHVKAGSLNVIFLDPLFDCPF